MTHQQTIIGVAVLALATVQPVTNAFVSFETHSRIARGGVAPTVQQRRQLLSRRDYSNNNIDDNNNKKRFVSPEQPIDPTSSSSENNIEFLFNDDSSINLGDMTPPSISETTAQSIFAENAAVLSAGDDTIDLGFDVINIGDINTGSATTTDDAALVNEDLKAVLAASVEAAAAAEASMSPELVEVLDELAIASLNVTTIDDIMPLEVVPTIATNSAPIILGDQQLKASVLPTVEELSLLEDSHTDVATTNDSDDIGTKARAMSTPSVGKILKFAIPAIGVWLCGPLLSLIDTSAVGVFSGTIQQAALNPAVAVTDYAALLIVSVIITITIIVRA